MSPLHRPLPHDPRSSQPVCGPRGDSWGHTLPWVTVTCIHCPPPCTAEGHSWKGPSPPPHASWLVARDVCYVYMLHGAIPVGPSHSPQTRTCARARAACRREVRQQPCVLGRSDSSRVCWEVRQLQHTDVCARATRQEGQQTHVRPDRRASTHTCDQTGVAPDSSNSSAMSVCRGLVLSVCPMMCDCTRGVPMVLRWCVCSSHAPREASVRARHAKRGRGVMCQWVRTRREMTYGA